MSDLKTGGQTPLYEWIAKHGNHVAVDSGTPELLNIASAYEANIRTLERELTEAIQSVSTKQHGASGLCCQLRLQEKERADKAEQALAAHAADRAMLKTQRDEAKATAEAYARGLIEIGQELGIKGMSIQIPRFMHDEIVSLREQLAAEKLPKISETIRDAYQAKIAALTAQLDAARRERDEEREDEAMRLRHGNALFLTIIERMKPFYPANSRDLEWEVLPGVIAAALTERDALRAELAAVKADCVDYVQTITDRDASRELVTRLLSIAALRAQLARCRAALIGARFAMHGAACVIRNHIMGCELSGLSPNAFPDALNGCVSGGGLEVAIKEAECAIAASHGLDAVGEGEK